MVPSRTVLAPSLDRLVSPCPAGAIPGTPVRASLAPNLPGPITYDLSYRDVFWRHRHYEDRCDRIALRALLPASGGRLLDLGAGFGRLLGEYDGWAEVTLLDAAEPLLDAARERSRDDARVRCVRADVSRIPLPSASLDAVVCVRVIHHLSDPGPAFEEIARVLRPGGVLVLEAANRRNLKAVLRWLAGRQSWSPFGPGPVEYLPGHVDHAPADIDRSLAVAGLRVERVRTASLCRVPVIARHLPAGWLAALDGALGGLLGSLGPGPSRWVLARRLAPHGS
jgi:SAM-dependent methyltransferase